MDWGRGILNRDENGVSFGVIGYDQVRSDIWDLVEPIYDTDIDDENLSDEEAEYAYMNAEPVRHQYKEDEDGIEFPQNTAGLIFNEHWYNNRAIGCGPYEFLRWDQGKIIQLKRFEDFKGDLPPIKRINYHLIRDKHQQLLNFHSKE